MKKHLKAYAAVVAASLCVAALGTVGVSATSNSDNYVKANEGTTSSAETNVQHSMMLAGTNVSSNDTVDGILMAAGANVDINGKDTYGLAAGAVVNVSGTIDKDLFAIGSSVSLNQSANLGRDVYVAGGVVNVKSNINGNAFIAGGTVNLSDVTIKGDLKIYAEEVVFAEKVNVSGQVQYNNDAKVKGSDKLQATGGTSTYTSEVDFGSMLPFSFGGESDYTPSYGDYAMLVLLSITGLLITAIVINAIFPGIYKKLSHHFDTMKAGVTVKNIVFGLCAIIAVPIVSLILMVTIVGLPLGLITLAFYAVCAYLSFALAGGYVGHLLLTKAFKSKANAYLELLIGVVALGILLLIPVINVICALAAVLLGFGFVMELICNRTAKK